MARYRVECGRCLSLELSFTEFVSSPEVDMVKALGPSVVRRLA